MQDILNIDIILTTSFGIIPDIGTYLNSLIGDIVEAFKRYYCYLKKMHFIVFLKIFL